MSQGFEATLIERVPEATRIVTSWEDSYARAVWQGVLARQGYVPLDAPVVRSATYAKAAAQQE